MRIITKTFVIALLFSFVSFQMSFAQGKATFEIGKNPIKHWIELIDRAQTSIDVATYKFSSREALEALVDASERGVTVRLLIDGKEADKVRKQVAKAVDSGIETYIWPTDKLGEFHGKFTVIDSTTLIMGSFNLSKAAVAENTESFMTSFDSTLVESATKSFQELLTKAERFH